MIIGGMRKLSTLDYPGKLCVTVFAKGCNFRCPFCHNASLVLGEAERITEDEIFSLLKKRQGLVDAVCLTGGEPLLYDVRGFLEKVKALGFLVKLDTNGSFPEKLSSLVNDGIVDYVAMDIKNSLSRYKATAGADVNTENIKKSVAFLLEGKTDFEFRTTVVKGLHDMESMEEIGKWIKGNEKYYLQMFVPSENTIQQGLDPYTKDELEALRQVVLNYVPNTFLRGV
ncbi:MAG: anaerobic ribonucleoside-triphosphate reductase activating protein [Ruminococcaceae bacterium]|nr:anaerobic ribonucleoside-triphosphate reductase activating protein [Oscillospiraceae bacterium]